MFCNVSSNWCESADSSRFPNLESSCGGPGGGFLVKDGRISRASCRATVRLPSWTRRPRGVKRGSIWLREVSETTSSWHDDCFKMIPATYLSILNRLFYGLSDLIICIPETRDELLPSSKPSSWIQQGIQVIFPALIEIPREGAKVAAVKGRTRRALGAGRVKGSGRAAEE